MMSKPKFVYVTFIRTTPEQLWSALTESGIHQEILVRRASRDRLEGRLAVANGFPRWP